MTRRLAVVLSGLVLSALVLSSGCGSKPAAPPAAEPPRNMKLIAPRGEVDGPVHEFSWSAVPGAAGYNVQISDDDTIWPLIVKRLSTTTLVLSEKESAAITSGRIHIWEVAAQDAHDVTIASGATRFRVKPPGE